ncbi:MAG: LuxR C-terminal-related transcriptional regulator [bacterium]|nr:LuxR C-terminal-related transcriptional regulator [bacterium]
MNIEEFLEDKQIETVLNTQLSKRELEVLRALSKGYDVAEIAKKLKISRNTIKVYLSNLSIKVNLPTSNTNFRVAMCIFYNKFKKELEECKK